MWTDFGYEIDQIIANKISGFFAIDLDFALIDG